MEQEKMGSLETLESRINDIVDLYVDGKIDSIQFWVLKNFEFDVAQTQREEDIRAAYFSGFCDNNFNQYDNQEDLWNESDKNARLYLERNKNK
jgi:hypothetical protein